MHPIKVTRRAARPGERLFGGKGALIPIRKPPAKSSAEPSTKPAAQNQTAPKAEPDGESPNDPS